MVVEFVHGVLSFKWKLKSALTIGLISYMRKNVAKILTLRPNKVTRMRMESRSCNQGRCGKSCKNLAKVFS